MMIIKHQKRESDSFLTYTEKETNSMKSSFFLFTITQNQSTGLLKRQKMEVAYSG